MTFFFYHKPVLIKKNVLYLPIILNFVLVYRILPILSGNRGASSWKMKNVVKITTTKLNVPSSKQIFTLNHPSLLICYWSQKCAAPAKKIKKYWNSMIGMKTEVTTNKILRFYVQHMTFILQLSKCRSRMSYRKGFKSLYILRYNHVEKIWYSA